MIDFSIYNTVYSYSSAGDVNKFDECAEAIKKSFGVVVKNKFLVGCKLLQIWSDRSFCCKYKDVQKRYDLYNYGYRTSHQNVFYAVCDEFFGLDKKEVQLYMNVADSFADKETFEIKSKYKDFKWYQLVEMVPLSEEQREKISPTWPRQKIRDYKKSLTQPKEEKKEEPEQDEIWLGQEDDSESESSENSEKELEEEYDDVIYKRELELLSKNDVINKALENRRLCYELQQQVISLCDEVEYYKKLAIGRVS